MYVIVRDPITNANVEVDSLTGFLKGPPVETVFLGTPWSESPVSPKPSIEPQSASVRHFVLMPKVAEAP
jgi:hypothetical protein